MLDPNDATLRGYEEQADRYVLASASGVNPEVAALLDTLITRLTVGGRVLEVGSGPGLEASYMEQHGLMVDRTDATDAFVQRLRSQGHEARLLDVRHGELGGPYDAIFANAVLLHLDRTQMRLALARCLGAVRHGGLLALTVKAGDGESWSVAKLGVPRWFVYWRSDDLQKLLSEVGWTVLDLRMVTGRTDNWLHVLCER